MKKYVDVKPYKILSVKQKVLDNLPTGDETVQKKKFIKGLKKSSSKALLVLNPETKQLFTTTGIINHGNVYISFFPDPVLVFFSQAYDSYLKSKKIVSDFDNHIILNSNDIKIINSEIYNIYLSQRISAIIFLFTALEAFVNSVIPDEFIYKRKKDTESENLNKKDIERFVPVIEKIDCILSQQELVGIDFKQQYPTIYGNIKKIQRERNNLIHLKTSRDDKNVESFLSMFGKILNDDFEHIFISVEKFMNIVKPNFIEIKETSLT